MKLMVYGTLQNGHGNNYLLQDATYLGKAVTKKPYVMFHCGFPKAVPFTLNADTHPLLPVHGEVFEVDERTLRRCDMLEGHPSWYNRQIIPISLEGEDDEAYLYEMPEWQNNKLCNIINGIYHY